MPCQYAFVHREDLSNLPFTTMCIREALRLHAPVQAVTRRYTQDMALPGDCTVPEGERETLESFKELSRVLFFALSFHVSNTLQPVSFV